MRSIAFASIATMQTLTTATTAATVESKRQLLLQQQKKPLCCQTPALLSLLPMSCCLPMTMASSSSTSTSINGGSESVEETAEAKRERRILASSLYVQVSPDKEPLVYSSAYNIGFMGLERLHPFDSAKWGRIRDYLVNEGVIDARRIVEPSEATTEDLLVVHTEKYLQSLTKSFTVASIIEVPPVALLPTTIVKRQVLQPFRRQGNGHERDFADDERVYILDMYNRDIYPFDAEARNAINQRVDIGSGMSTKDYLLRLEAELRIAKQAFHPDYILYNAGTDILDGDPLGRLCVSADGIKQRDEMVFEFAKDLGVPIVMVTSGGYMMTSARVIADSITNLLSKGLITLRSAKPQSNVQSS